MIKKILLLLLFSISCYAQNSFVAVSHKVVWENVFISEEINIPQLLERHVRLSIVSSDGNSYKGKGTLIKNTCPGTSDFMKDNLNFNFEIQQSEGKYSVTITDITFTTAKGKNKMHPLEKYLIDRKGNLKQDTQSQADANCLDAYFTRIFGMKKRYKN